MNPTLHAQIQTLRKYQAWRTGEDTRTMDDAGIVPAAVTSALDAVLEVADSCLRDATKPAEPSGYAYRYRDHLGGTVLRFNNGGEVNGSRPIEAVPYWFAPPNATTVTCQLYGHPLKTCAECNHELACSAKTVSVPSDELQGLANRAYCQYIEQMRRSECLGWEQKVKDRRFGEAELIAHTKAGEFFGRHRAFSEARALLAKCGQQGYTAADMASAAADGFRKGEMSAGEDAARYRTLRAMPPGIRVQVHVGEGEWEDVCSGDDLDRIVRNAMDAP